MRPLFLGQEWRSLLGGNVVVDAVGMENEKATTRRPTSRPALLRSSLQYCLIRSVLRDLEHVVLRVLYVHSEVLFGVRKRVVARFVVARLEAVRGREDRDVLVGVPRELLDEFSLSSSSEVATARSLMASSTSKVFVGPSGSPIGGISISSRTLAV